MTSNIAKVIQSIENYQNLKLEMLAVSMIYIIVGMLFYLFWIKTISSKNINLGVMLLVPMVCIFFCITAGIEITAKKLNYKEVKNQATNVINNYSRKHPIITIAKQSNNLYVIDKPINKLKSKEMSVAQIPVNISGSDILTDKFKNSVPIYYNSGYSFMSADTTSVKISQATLAECNTIFFLNSVLNKNEIKLLERIM